MTKKMHKRTWVLIFGGLTVLLAFIGFNMRDLIFGAPLHITNIHDGEVVRTAIVSIAGSARNATAVTINGREAAIDTHGAFADEIILSPGYNILEIARSDRFGNTKTRLFHIAALVPDTVALAPSAEAH